MKLIIETKYTLLDNDGALFSETGAKTEGEVETREAVSALVERHEEKLGKREGAVRNHVEDYTNLIPDKENF